MSSHQTKREVSELLEQAQEYVRYFEELGAETVGAESFTLRTSAFIEPASAKIEQTRKLEPALMPPATPSAPKPNLFARTTSKAAMETTAAGDLFGAPSTPSLAKSTETLDGIWRDIGDCTRCGLCEGRTQVVNTHGNPKARLMFVGEAPGADEDAQGKPFVGRAGQLLTKMIEAMGLKREEVIIGNVNRCRPPGNRQPTLEEAAICRPFLYREIAVIHPAVIVVMGNTALRNLLEIKAGISSVRGQFRDYQGIKVMPTFHPAYLLRDPSKKRETWEDLKKVMEYLDSSSG